MKGLTRRQQEVLAFIEDYVRTHGFPPSVRDIAKHLSLLSASGVHKHIKALVRKNYLSKQEFTSRSLRVLKRSGTAKAVAADWVEWSVLGMLEGRTLRQGPRGYPPVLRVPVSWLTGVSPGFVLYVESDAFPEHRVHPGDALLFTRDAQSKPQDLLLVHDHGTYGLLNKQTAAASPNLDVRGVLVGLWRSYRRPGGNVS